MEKINYENITMFDVVRLILLKANWINHMLKGTIMVRGNPMRPPIVPVADMSFFKSGLSKFDKYNQFRSSALIHSAKYPPRMLTHCATVAWRALRYIDCYAI